MTISNTIQARFIRGVVPMAVLLLFIDGWIDTRVFSMMNNQYYILLTVFSHLSIALIITAMVAYVGREVETRVHQSDQDLRDKEHLLSESQRLGHVGSWFWRMEGPLSWSEEMYRIYRISPDTFTPTVESWIGLIHPDDRPAMQSCMAACAAGEVHGELEYRIVTPDGSIRFLLGRGAAVFDAENKPIHMAGTVQDITERKRAEEELHRQAEELKARNEELTRFSRDMSGRELRMIELKQEVNAVAARFDQPRPYALAFLDAVTDRIDPATAEGGCATLDQREK